MASDNPLADPMGHTLDADVFEFPGGKHWNVWEWSQPVGDFLGPIGIHGLTKFMLLELVAAALCLLILVPYALNVRVFGYAKGRFANLIESVLFFIKKEVAEPALGHHHAHQFLPYLWSVFFFILCNNLIGMVPWMGAATGAFGTTIALALCSFLMIHGGGIRELGFFHYLDSIAPPGHLAIRAILFPIEIIGHIVKPSILAFRLFINMVAGHTVLFVLIAFIKMVGPSITYFAVLPGSFLGVLMISMLELFVAFLQAFVFTYLSAIFIGAAVHPHH
jgi:F-type H+-transporting ATPase subunit a